MSHWISLSVSINNISPLHWTIDLNYWCLFYLQVFERYVQLFLNDVTPESLKVSQNSCQRTSGTRVQIELPPYNRPVDVVTVRRTHMKSLKEQIKTVLTAWRQTVSVMAEEMQGLWPRLPLGKQAGGPCWSTLLWSCCQALLDGSGSCKLGPQHTNIEDIFKYNLQFFCWPGKNIIKTAANTHLFGRNRCPPHSVWHLLGPDGLVDHF